MIKFIIGFIVLAAVSFIAVWGLADVTYKQGKKERIKQEDQKWQERWNKDIERRLILCGEDSTIYDGEAMKVPRISFERFLNLYSVSPEKWIITTNEYHSNHNFPFYVNEVRYINKRGKECTKQVVIPLYWENAEELKKYYNWVEEQFEKGDAALYQNARDKTLKELTNYIQNDLQEKRKQFEEEMQELESRTKQDMEKLEKKREIQLTLEPQPSKKYYTTDPNFNVANYVGQGQELPTQNLNVGDVFHELDTDTLFYYTKDGWDVLRPFAG